jgi:hypothetical protein
MRPDYLDRQTNATAWARVIDPPHPHDDMSRALRQAFVPPEQTEPEWDRLLARLP